MTFFAILLSGSWAAASSHPVYRLQIQPLDFQDEDNFLTPFMSDIIFDGNFLFVQSKKYSEFYQLTTAGEVVQVHGKLGSGPGELSGPPIGLAVDRNRFCVISPNRMAQIYIDGRFVRQFKLASYLRHPHNSSANGIAFLDRYVVIPSAGYKNSLALAYRIENPDEKHPVGTLAELDVDALRGNPYGADTNWCSDTEFLYGTFDYFPMVLKYDHSFNLVTRFALTVPAILDEYQATLEFEPRPKIQTHANPLIKDIKVTASYLYIFSGIYLYRLDKKTGKVLAAYSFYGRGPDFERLDPGHRLNLLFFAPLNDRRVVLGHRAPLWNHDLWLVDLPE